MSAKLVEGASSMFMVNIGPSQSSSSPGEFDLPAFPLPSPLDCDETGSVSSETLDMDAPFMDDLMDGMLQELPPVEPVLRKSTTEPKQRQVAPTVTKPRKKLLVCVKDDACVVLDPATLNELQRKPFSTTAGAAYCVEEHGQGHLIHAIAQEPRSLRHVFLSSRDPLAGEEQASSEQCSNMNDLREILQQVEWEFLFFRAYSTSSGWFQAGYLPKDEVFMLRWNCGFTRQSEDIITISNLAWDLECIRRSVVALVMVDVRVLMLHSTAPGQALYFHGFPGGCAEASKLPVTENSGVSTEFSVSAWVSRVFSERVRKCKR